MRRIAIIGTVPISKRVAPYEDKSWEIWGCSPGNSQGGALPRIDRWYEMHALVGLRGPEHAGFIPAYLAWLNAQTFPVFMQEPNPEVPRAMAFPRDKMLKRFGPHKRGDINWFTSSIAWMIAHAIVEIEESGVKGEIGIFGVDMAATEEHYSWQKAGCQRFMEFAHEAGVTVTIPLESTLAQPAPLYAYDQASPMGRSMAARHHEMGMRVKQIEQTMTAAQQELAFFRGAMEELSFVQRTFVSGLDDAILELPTDVSMHDAAAKQTAEQMIAHPDTFVKEDGSGLLTPSKKRRRDPAKPPTVADFPNAPGAQLLANTNGLDRAEAQEGYQEEVER